MAYIESGLYLSYSICQSSFADLCFTTFSLSIPRYQDNVYLYLDTSKKQWRFASDLGGKKNMFFATEEKSSALCPADPAAEVASSVAAGTFHEHHLLQGHWQTATGTFGRMKKNANVKVVCSRI